MKSFSWNLLLFATPVILAVALMSSMVDDSYKKGFKDGVASVPKPDAPSGQVLDNMCAKWMFESNFKEAKRRMCGRKN